LIHFYKRKISQTGTSRLVVGATPLSAAPAYGVLVVDSLVWPKL